ncbi:HEXXH motif domain-containing protein [Spirillospora albida]|uniref:HEXXH motif domain-containing protein n=1 Tax=Spirillospora albida TaxID=58123 RepID=UPI000690B7EA|nr:HEXXH motif domain-containing protein [Spirillospora albida]
MAADQALARHSLPADVFLDLARGGGGAVAAGHLHDAQYSRRLLLLQGVPRLAEECGHEHAGRIRRAYALLAGIQREAPEAAEAVVRYPTVGSWVTRALYALTGQPPVGSPADPVELAAVAAAAAVRSRRSATIEVPIVAGGVTLPSLGRAAVPGADGFAVVRSGPGGAEITAGRHRITLPGGTERAGRESDPGEPGWEALRWLTAEHRGVRAGFVLDDHDPHRMPGARWSERPLTGAEPAEWGAMLQRTWRVLVERHPAVVADVLGTLAVVTPLRAPGGESTSATSKLAFGNIGMSAPTEPFSFAVTLAHEVQHAKLSALIDLMPLTLPDDGGLYYAPWREDPRPLAGLLHGAYAHMAIAAFWRTERTQDHPGQLALRADTEFAHWRDGTREAIGTLRASGRLTRAGELFTAEMARVMDAMSGDEIPAAARDLAGDSAGRHLARWRLLHGARPGGSEPAGPGTAAPG